MIDNLFLNISDKEIRVLKNEIHLGVMVDGYPKTRVTIYLKNDVVYPPSFLIKYPISFGWSPRPLLPTKLTPQQFRVLMLLDPTLSNNPTLLKGYQRVYSNAVEADYHHAPTKWQEKEI